MKATVERSSPPRAPVSLRVVVLSGTAKGQALVLTPGVAYRVGRAPSSHLVLPDESVSSSHLTVEALADTARFVDLGSRNGSFCQGVRFSEVEAPPGSVLRLGETELRLLPMLEFGDAPLPSANTQFGELLGSSLPMRQLFAVLERLAVEEVDVLLSGETGTGKERCARSLHGLGPRASGPFVTCDMRAVSPALLESELFGHVKGAFTGATSDRAGAFERARGGTLMLDEVGELPREQQPLLLGALERREVKPVGADEPRAVDVRVVATTAKDLEAEVQAGRFRADLYHRLAAFKVSLPPLRERGDDIPALVAERLRQLGKAPELLSPDTRAMLGVYRWPGNVRELFNVVERAVHLGPSAALASLGGGEVGELVGGEQGPVTYKQAKDRLLDAFERDYLVELLTRCDGNVSLAARRAGLDRVYVGRLLKKHGIDAQQLRSRRR